MKKTTTRASAAKMSTKSVKLGCTYLEPFEKPDGTVGRRMVPAGETRSVPKALLAKIPHLEAAKAPRRPAILPPAPEGELELETSGEGPRE
jgi:hypothetical protein